MAVGRKTVATVACALALAVPATAGAQRLSGNTSQKGSEIRLKTNAAGEVTEGRIDYRARCRFHGTVVNHTFFGQPLRRSNRGGFAEEGGYRAIFKDKVEGRFRAAIEGERLGEGRFRGTFKLSARFTDRHGRYLNTCRTGRIKWSAKTKG